MSEEVASEQGMKTRVLAVAKSLSQSEQMAARLRLEGLRVDIWLDKPVRQSDLHDAIRTLEVKVPPWRGSLPGGEDLGENSSNLWNMISSL